MIVAIDVREKKPYGFKYYTKTVSLPVGDYSIVGFEHRIGIERKSASDLMACLSQEREIKRFERELFKSQGLEYFCMVVETSFKDLANRKGYRSKTLSGTSLKTLIDLSVRYRVPVFFADYRHYGNWIVESILEKYWAGLVKTAEIVKNTKRRD